MFRQDRLRYEKKKTTMKRRIAKYIYVGCASELPTEPAILTRVSIAEFMSYLFTENLLRYNRVSILRSSVIGDHFLVYMFLVAIARLSPSCSRLSSGAEHGFPYENTCFIPAPSQQHSNALNSFNAYHSAGKGDGNIMPPTGAHLDGRRHRSMLGLIFNL